MRIRPIHLFVLSQVLGCPFTKHAGDTGGVDADRDGYPFTTECDDGNPAIHPDASEICDGLDNNCDGTVDEGVATTYHVDADGDGYGSEDASVEACGVPAGYVLDAGDCDDTTAARNPSKEEVCDELDNDCDGEVDEEVTLFFCADMDGDGTGDPSTARTGCAPGAGETSDCEDCDDTDPLIGPGAAETWYDGIDQDCDGIDDPLVRWRGESPHDRAGGSLAGTADVTGDGVDDLIVGAWGADDERGKVYLVSGPVTADGTLGLETTISGLAAGDKLGYGVAGPGDVDGDGWPDILLGARNYEGAGGAFLVRGPVTGNVHLPGSATVLHGAYRGSCAGQTVSSAGDVNDDGLVDVLVGAPYSSIGAFLLLGPVTSGSLADADGVYSYPDWVYLGESAAPAGDVNGDGLDDFLLGAWGGGPGTVGVFLGPATGAMDAPDFTLTGEHGDDAAGAAVAAGDLDADGYRDAIIGAIRNDERGTDAGKVYAVYGPLTGDVLLESADVQIVGDMNGAYLGAAVSSGDVDGDGLDDLIAGAPYRERYRGTAFVFYSPLPSTASVRETDILVSGDLPDDYLGTSLALDADLDLDGRADLAMGWDGGMDTTGGFTLFPSHLVR